MLYLSVMSSTASSLVMAASHVLIDKDENLSAGDPGDPVNFSYLQVFVNQATATKSSSSVSFSSCLSLTSSIVACPSTELIRVSRNNSGIMFLFIF